MLTQEGKQGNIMLVGATESVLHLLLSSLKCIIHLLIGTRKQQHNKTDKSQKRAILQNT